MREFSEPATADVADEDNLSDMVFATAERFGGSVLYRRKARDTWIDVTAREFAEQVLAVAKGLVAAGIEPGDRVGLLSATRYEWTLLDFAILTVGGVTVPIYETSSAEQIQWILSDSGARALLIETPAHRDRLNSIRGELPGLDHVWQLDEAAGELTALGAGAGVADEDMHERRRRVRAKDTASLVYTSGTTGRPKGCQLTHRNVLAEVRTVIRAAPELLNPGASVLLFLPLAHVFARLIQFGALHARVTLGHTADARNLLDDLAEFRPTLVLSVPRVLEKIYTGARQRALAASRGRIFEFGEATAVAWSQAHQHDRPGLRLRLAHAVFDRLMFQRLRATLGGRCAAAICGGAPLGERLGHFFAGVGIPVYEGYGLTETSAAVTLNTPARHKIGTVGRPLPGVTVRLGDDREIQVAGDVVFRGYWNNEQATAAAFTRDGWFRTGDLGELDDEGYLRITGRRKELIVTAAGKNVAPAELEDRLRTHPLISQAMVVGDGQPFVAALITLDASALQAWGKEHGRPGEAGELASDDQLRGEIQTAVDDANQAVSRAETIKKFLILPDDFSQDGGELTPTLKLRREVVAKRYASQIESLYR